jgi:hypothetical protein
MEKRKTSTRAVSFSPPSAWPSSTAQQRARALPRSLARAARSPPSGPASQVGPLAPVRSLPVADTLAPHVIPLLPLFSPVAAAWWPASDHDLGNPIRPDQHGLLHPANLLHHSTTKLELRRPLTDDDGGPQSTVSRENAPPKT